MRWAEFAATCPELAGLVRQRFEDQQILLLGTIRPDGTPRISGVECDFAGHDLMTGMMWKSVKATDLLRDPRVTVHTLVPDKAHESEGQGDIKLYGRAVAVTDPDVKHTYEDAIEKRINWRPPEPYHCFALDIERAGLVRFEGDYRHVWTWRQGEALSKRTMPALGPE